MSQPLFKHLIECSDCEEKLYVVNRREELPGFCPQCGGSSVSDGSAPAIDSDEDE